MEIRYEKDVTKLIGTVKAPNFGPHGNFGPLFQKGWLSLKRVLQKKEENKSCRKPLDLQIRFCSFFVHDSSTKATELARKSPKFPCGPKLEAFTVRNKGECVFNVRAGYLAIYLPIFLSSRSLF
jgi:hypothetical protein